MELISGLLLILGSGFFSGSETAVYRAQWIRLTTWSNRRIAGARLAIRLLNWREPTVIAALVGTNLCNVFSAVLVSEFVAARFGSAWTGVAVVTVVALTFVCGEYLPKALATAQPSRWLRRTSLPLAIAMALFAPAVLLLAGVARVFATPLAQARARLTLTRQDFLAALRQRERQPQNGDVAQRGQPISSMVARLFRLSGARVGEARIPLERVQAVPEGAPRARLLAVIDEHGYSRIPVYRDAPDNIVGVVFAKDLLATSTYRVRTIDRVRESARLTEVLERMQRRGEHIALVTDQGDRPTGIVTLEDILEELVGEIRSED